MRSLLFLWAIFAYLVPGTKYGSAISVADPHQDDADRHRYPAFHLNADPGPDPAFHFDAYADCGTKPALPKIATIISDPFDLMT
jgi:hypothetical protein